MRILYNDSLIPQYNLAAEEYLLENSEDEVFMLWRNESSIIIGKNQAVWAEVNTDFTMPRATPIVRRITGGGAVYHDLGNVNFTCITNAPEDGGIDFAPHTALIIAALRELGIAATLSGRNDILAKGYKVSGNAQCTRVCKDGRRRLLHHGTLLYDTNMSDLAAALLVNQEKLRTKGIRSVTSRVGNIKEIGKVGMSVTGFIDHLLDFAERWYDVSAKILTDEEMAGTDALAMEKYYSWIWNFGESPKFEHSRTERFPFGTLTAWFTLNRGVIEKLSITGDYFGTEEIAHLERRLIGCRFDRTAAWEAMRGMRIGRFISGAETEDILVLLFGDATYYNW